MSNNQFNNQSNNQFNQVHDLMNKIDDLKESLTSEQYKDLCDSLKSLNTSLTKVKTDEFDSRRYMIHISYPMTYYTNRRRVDDLFYDSDDESEYGQLDEDPDDIELVPVFKTKMVTKNYTVRFKKSNNMDIILNTPITMRWSRLRDYLQNTDVGQYVPVYNLIDPTENKLNYVTKELNTKITIKNTEFVVVFMSIG